MKRATRGREGYHWFRGWRRPTTAQRRVLDELLRGGTNAQIASRLGISEDGVKWHLSELREELEINDRQQLAEWWRSRRSQSMGLFGFGGMGRLFGSQSAALVAAVAVAAVGLAWLAYSSLAGSGDAKVSVVALQTPGSVPAAIVPTPTATPVPATAIVFDVESRSVTVLPGSLAGRRWLDTRPGTFVGYSSTGLAVIDWDGAITPLPGEVGTTDYYPVPDAGEVLLWRSETGVLTTVDAESRMERTLAQFERDARSARRWAVSTAGRRIALTDHPEVSEVRSYALDGGDERLMYRSATDVGIVHVAWSPDGARLLVLLGPRLDADRIGPADRFIVVDASGGVVLSREGATARWAGNVGLLTTPSAGRSDNARFLSVPGGSESPAPPPSSLTCVSPDGRYGVVVTEVPGSGNTRVEFRHQLLDLGSDASIAEARTSQWLVSCDWTADSRKVVLSPGGK